MIQPRDRFVRGEVGCVALKSLTLSVHLDEIGVVVTPLPRQDFPIIKTDGVGTQVPLADNGGTVAVGMQVFDEGPLVRVESISIPHEAVFVAVFPCQNRRSRGAADRIRAERIQKNRALSRELINVGCWG